MVPNSYNEPTWNMFQVTPLLSYDFVFWYIIIGLVKLITSKPNERFKIDWG